MTNPRAGGTIAVHRAWDDVAVLIVSGHLRHVSREHYEYHRRIETRLRDLAYQSWFLEVPATMIDTNRSVPQGESRDRLRSRASHQIVSLLTTTSTVVSCFKQRDGGDAPGGSGRHRGHGRVDVVWNSLNAPHISRTSFRVG